MISYFISLPSLKPSISFISVLEETILFEGRSTMSTPLGTCEMVSVNVLSALYIITDIRIIIKLSKYYFSESKK